MKPQDRRFMVSAGFGLLTLLLTVSAESAPLIGVADERLEPSQLVLHPLVEFEQATLTVEGPAGYALERAFAPGEAVRLALTGGNGRTLPDGRYKYSLRLSPRPEGSSGVQDGLFFIDEGSGVSRAKRRDQLASIRQDLYQEGEERILALEQAATIPRKEVTMTVSPPASFALSVDGDFALGGYVFQAGMPFIHNYGGSFYGNTALGLGALIGVTPGSDPPYYVIHGWANTAVGRQSLQNNTTGSANTAIGTWALSYNTIGGSNTAIGLSALSGNYIGHSNTASGAGALALNRTGSRNTATGSAALFNNYSGHGNTAIGYSTLDSNTTGSRNVALGYHAGWKADTGDDNIFISNDGVAGESGSIRIGTQGTQSQTYIAGIYPTVLSEAAGYVVTDASGQLGVQLFVSSERYKEGIGDIGEASERLMQLRPAQFQFKEEFPGGEAGVQFGLIAEEVAEVFPELVTLDAEGQAYAVKYRFLPPLLLNEFQKQARRLHGQERLLAAQEQQLREQQETLEVQQRLLAEQRSNFERLLLEQRRELEALANRLALLEGSGPPLALEARGRPKPSPAPATP